MESEENKSIIEIKDLDKIVEKIDKIVEAINNLANAIILK